MARRSLSGPSFAVTKMLRPFTLVAAVALAGTASAGPPPELRWGGDAEGGAPIVQADPQDPSKVRGFDVDVAEAIARGLGRRARFVQCAFASIDQSVARGDFDLGMSGVEETPARRAALAVTIPYFEFREVLTVREADAARFRGLADLKRRRVGTLGGTIAYDLLLGSEKTPGIEAVSYEDGVHPYEDLAKGRLDGVVLDHILAARSVARVPGLVIQPEALAVGHYVIVLAKGNEALRDRIDDVLRARMKDGALAAIFRRWGVWDEGEGAFFERTLAAAAAAEPRATAAPSAPPRPPQGRLALAPPCVPALPRAALG